MNRLLVLCLALIVTAPAAAAKRLDVAASKASSTYPQEEQVRYDPEGISDGKLSTAWVEGESGSGLGEWVEVDLGGQREVHKLKIWGGMWYSTSYWNRANRPKEIELTFSDGTKQKVVLADKMEPQEVEISPARQTSSIRIEIGSVYPGSTWLDTPISEVQVFDDQSEPGAAVRGATASSQLADDSDGSYAPANMLDGLVDSMWCEGTDEDGTNESITFQLAGNEQISSLQVINGMGTGLPYWMKNNRASAATLEFSDGTTQQITLKNTMLLQKVDFAPVTTSSVKVTFTAVVKGKEYNDLCISEARFE